MKVFVSKLSKNKNRHGVEISMLNGLPFTPELGKRLVITSDTMTTGGIITSEVTSIKFCDNCYTIETLNSVYEIKVVG